MIKINIEKQKEKGVSLVILEAYCNFCGDDAEKTCVRGIKQLSVEYPEYITESKRVPTDSLEWGKTIEGYKHSLFGSKIIKDFKLKYVCDNYELKEVVVKELLKQEMDSADICLECIKQLSTLV